MAKQDKTGTKYEQILVSSLRYLGYVNDTDSGLNYLNPGKRNRNIVVPNTYIQPDIVVRDGTEIKAILYVTHWSKQRNCAFKFWRTWEELAQQKIVVANDFLGINCLFEALSEELEPSLYINSDDLPIDIIRGKQFPIGFKGWYPGTSWALTESFDVSLAFPFGYAPVHDSTNQIEGNHDLKTTCLLDQALQASPKSHLASQWGTLHSIRTRAINNLPLLNNTESRYRTGLLHVYIFFRIVNRILPNNSVPIENFLITLSRFSQDKIDLRVLVGTQGFTGISYQNLLDVLTILSQVYISKSEKSETFCSLSSFTNPEASSNNSLHRVSFNEDLQVYLNDLRHHLSIEGFSSIIERTFKSFDLSYRIDENFDDLADISLVKNKVDFVRTHFLNTLNDVDKLFETLILHSQNISIERSAISCHGQNWVLEILLYLTNINSAEDIYPIISPIFEESGHRLRPHSPFNDYTVLVVYMLQGRDVCENWSRKRRKGMTLDAEEFRRLIWLTMARCIVKIFKDKNIPTPDINSLVRRYLVNKSMRIISSGLSGFHIMIEQYLGDLCNLIFVDDEDERVDNISSRFLSWQTEVIKALFSADPLETRMEGIARNGTWLIKLQSAPSNPGDKTKELAGRCRALRLAWSHGQDPRDRTQWTFSERPLPKLALVLDGDWDANKKRNLYEAGWDWVGDVAQLGELRRLIQQDG